MIDQTAPLLENPNGFGAMEVEDWQALSDWMSDNDLLEKEVDASDVVVVGAGLAAPATTSRSRTSTGSTPVSRTASGMLAAPRAASMLAAKSRCCSSISKFTSRLLSGQAQQPLGDYVALNLVGARVDRAAESEQ